MYEKLINDILEHDNFFKFIPDPIGKLGASINLRLFIAVTMIREGITAFSMVKEAHQSAPHNRKCMKRFCKAIVNLYENEWLRHSSEARILEIESMYRKLGFRRFIDVVD